MSSPGFSAGGRPENAPPVNTAERGTADGPNTGIAEPEAGTRVRAVFQTSLLSMRSGSAAQQDRQARPENIFGLGVRIGFECAGGGAQPCRVRGDGRLTQFSDGGDLGQDVMGEPQISLLSLRAGSADRLWYQLAERGDGRRVAQFDGRLVS